MGWFRKPLFIAEIGNAKLTNFLSSPFNHISCVKTVTYKAYIDNVKAKTGKDPEYFQTLAKEKDLGKYGELLAWLKGDFGLGRGHANAIILHIQKPELAKMKIAEDSKKEKQKNNLKNNF